jgi:hypothetical protein
MEPPMPRRVRFDRQWLDHTWAAAALLSLAFAPPLAADAYMDAIKQEAHKIDQSPETPVRVMGAGSVSQDSQLAAFEQDLDQHSHGTYLFYKQLPARSQADVLEAHEQGASSDETRRMIMDRFLNS